MTTLDSFARYRTVLLTSFRRDGTPVRTPVSVAFADGRAFVRSPGTGYKVKRIARNPSVGLAPCTWRGRPTGPSLGARAERVEGEDARRAARALRRKHPILQGVLVPLAHRVMRCGTVYFELRPDSMRRD